MCFCCEIIGHVLYGLTRLVVLGYCRVGLLSYFDQMLSRGNFFLELQLVTKNPLSMCVFCGLAAMDKDIIEQLLRDFLGPMLPHPV